MNNMRTDRYALAAMQNWDRGREPHDEYKEDEEFVRPQDDHNECWLCGHPTLNEKGPDGKAFCSNYCAKAYAL